MNIAAIDPLTLPSLPLGERSRLPNCPAIYFVLNGTRVLYIGQTINLAQRWLTHHRWQQFSKQGESTRVAWLNLEDTELNLLPGIEAALIEYFRPELNGTALDTTRLRVTVTLSEEVHKTLSEWADEEERTLANLMAYIAAKAAKERQQQNETSSPAPKQKEKGAA